MSSNQQHRQDMVATRPVSDSPTAFSLAHRQISLAFLAQRDEQKKRVFALDLSRGAHPLMYCRSLTGKISLAPFLGRCRSLSLTGL